MGTDIIQAPAITVQFTGNEELQNVVMTVYIRSIGDAIRVASQDYNALQDLNRLFTEAKWITSDLMDKVWVANNAK